MMTLSRTEGVIVKKVRVQAATARTAYSHEDFVGWWSALMWTVAAAYLLAKLSIH